MSNIDDLLSQLTESEILNESESGVLAEVFKNLGRDLEKKEIAQVVEESRQYTKGEIFFPERQSEVLTQELLHLHAKVVFLTRVKGVSRDPRRAVFVCNSICRRLRTRELN